ncbi:MAG: hypothetical protein IKM60_02725 [Clostridia bacterium]|nr:hypothetical protein [Clostridia bacterium]
MGTAVFYIYAHTLCVRYNSNPTASGLRFRSPAIFLVKDTIGLRMFSTAAAVCQAGLPWHPVFLSKIHCARTFHFSYGTAPCKKAGSVAARFPFTF